MAVGCSTLCVEPHRDGAAALEIPASPTLAHVARPFNSPRRLPHKRPFQLSPLFSSPDTACMRMPEDFALEPSQAKWLKPSPQEETRLIEETVVATPELKSTNASKPKADQPSCPLHSKTPTAAIEEAKLEADQCHKAQELPSADGPRPTQTLEEAAKVAMELYMEAFTAYVLEKDLKNEDEAEKFAAQWAVEHYDELKRATLSLLPWTGEIKPAAEGSYDVISFQRQQPARPKGCGWITSIEQFREELRRFRLEGEQSRAWEALCAVLAAISSREEKGWLENFDVQDDLDDLKKKFRLCKTKGSARRRAAILDMIPRLVKEEGAGSFADHMVDATSVHRVTFLRGPGGPVPATSMTFRRMPFLDALKTMDDDGPLRGGAGKKEWIRAAGREFALQDLEFGHHEESRKGRKCAKSLEADGQIRDLLRSKRPVILLDTLAALAPRDICKAHGISNIVQHELATLFREAKARGDAVVFCLGTSSPHKLAEKVYLQPPVAAHGLRIGYLRWRESADVPWAREFSWEDRTAICLQMP